MFFTQNYRSAEFTTALTNDGYLDNSLIEKHKKTIISIKSHLNNWEKQRNKVNQPETEKNKLHELIAIANISLSLLLDLDATLSKDWKGQYVITQQQRLLLTALYYEFGASSPRNAQALLYKLTYNPKIFEPLYYVHVVEHNRYMEYAQFFHNLRLPFAVTTLIAFMPLLFRASLNDPIAQPIMLVLAALLMLVNLAVQLFLHIAKQCSNDSIHNNIANKIGHLNTHLGLYKNLAQASNDPSEDTADASRLLAY